jgi:hypothetical protein
MARIRQRPIDHRDERRDGTLARARTPALHLRLPLPRRRALHRLIAAAAALRHEKESA